MIGIVLASLAVGNATLGAVGYAFGNFLLVFGGHILAVFLQVLVCLIVVMPTEEDEFVVFLAFHVDLCLDVIIVL